MFDPKNNNNLNDNNSERGFDYLRYFEDMESQTSKTEQPTPPEVTNSISYSSFNNGLAHNPHYPYMEAQTTPVAKEKTPKSKRKYAFAAGVVSLAFVFSFLGSSLGNTLYSGDKAENTIQAETNQNADNDTTTEKNSILQTSTSNGTVMTVQEVAEIAAPSVVEITTESVTTGNRMQQLVSTGAGSGVVISADGYIVTNNHVIEDSSRITVTLKDGTQHQATLIGTDAKTDLAVLKIEATNLTPATIGTSSNIQVGQDAIVIGNPLGQLGGTVTNGIISALDREITFEDGTVMSLLQTNAAVNPGNSGGALFNNKGELVGIVNAKSSGTGIEGIGFAIPIDTAKPIIEDLIENGYVQGRVELGVTLLDISDQMTAMMYRVNKTGVYIYDIETSSNAAAAGLKSGDLIVSINGTEIAASTDVTAVLDKQSVGDKITFVVERNGQEETISFNLQEENHAKA